MSHPLIAQMLEAAIEELRKDLSVLQSRMTAQKEGMLISYTNIPPHERIVVHAPLKYKAYVPKKYQGFVVEFRVWNGGDFELDLDLLVE